MNVRPLTAAALLATGLATFPAAHAAPAAPPDAPGWVTGVVVDAAGDPVAGAMVNVLPPEEIPERGILDDTSDRWTTTDAAGRFRVRQAAEGFLVQVCDQDPERPWACKELGAADFLVRYVGPDGAYDSWLQHTDLYDAAATTLELGTVEVQPGARVHGHLAGAEDTTVELMRLNDTVAYRQPVNARGRYSFEGMAPGTYYLRAGGYGLLPWESEPFEIAAAEPTRVDGEVAAGSTLRGTLVDAATELGVRRTEVYLTDADGAWIASTLTRADGGFRFTGLAAGDYRVGLPAAGGRYLPHTEPVTIETDDEQAEARVRVRRGATVTVPFRTDGGRIDDELRDARGEVVQTLRGRDGSATYTGLAPGRYTVAAADDDGYGLRTFRVSDRGTHTLRVLRLEQELLTLHGRTAPGAVVEATTGDLCPPDAQETYGGFHEISDRADQQGRYVLRGLVPGDYMVAADAWPHNHAPICHEDVRVASSRGFDVPLQPGHTVTGRLVYAGTDLPVVTTLGYELTYPAGQVTNPTAEHPSRGRTRGGTGRFTITRLPDGPVTGGLVTEPNEEITAPRLFALFPFQDGTPYWLETEELPLEVTGDIALGDVDVTLRTGSLPND